MEKEQELLERQSPEEEAAPIEEAPPPEAAPVEETPPQKLAAGILAPTREAPVTPHKKQKLSSRKAHASATYTTMPQRICKSSFGHAGSHASWYPAPMTTAHMTAESAAAGITSCHCLRIL